MAAGGQPNGEVSAGSFVVDREPYAMVDLRVDLHPDPSPSSAGSRRLFPLVVLTTAPPRPSVPSAAEWLTAQRQRGGDSG